MMIGKLNSWRFSKPLSGIVALVLGGYLLAAPMMAQAFVCCDPNVPGSFLTESACVTAGCQFDQCKASATECQTTSSAPATETKTDSKTKDAGGVSSKNVGVPTPLSYSSPQSVIGRVINTLIGSVGVVALIMFIYAGFMMMTAGGAAEKMNKGKQTMVWAVIGLFLVFASYAIVSAIFGTLGVE